MTPLSGPAIAATCEVTSTNDAGGAASPSFDFHHVSVRGLIPTFAAYTLHVRPLFPHDLEDAHPAPALATDGDVDGEHAGEELGPPDSARTRG